MAVGSVAERDPRVSTADVVAGLGPHGGRGSGGGMEESLGRLLGDGEAGGVRSMDKIGVELLGELAEAALHVVPGRARLRGDVGDRGTWVVGREEPRSSWNIGWIGYYWRSIETYFQPKYFVWRLFGHVVISIVSKEKIGRKRSGVRRSIYNTLETYKKHQNIEHEMGMWSVKSLSNRFAPTRNV